jgi:Xaa-Pro aminopeptidase
MGKTIDEVRAAKHQLEREVADALDKFSAATGCPVDSVSFDRIMRFGESDAYIAQVDIRL